MTVELDHMLICTEVGTPGADQLEGFGLVEGTPNIHPGQGIANRAFFFHNAMLELVWVRDERKARSPPIAPARLWERWRCPASPDTHLSASAYARRTRCALSPGGRRRCPSRGGSGAHPTCLPERVSTSPPGWPQASRWCSLLRFAEGLTPSPSGAANRSSTPRGRRAHGVAHHAS